MKIPVNTFTDIFIHLHHYPIGFCNIHKAINRDKTFTQNINIVGHGTCPYDPFIRQFLSLRS